MVGTVRASTNASVPCVEPKVAAMTTSRTRPMPRLSKLPVAITAAAPTTRRCVRALLPWSTDGVTGAVRMWLQAQGGDSRSARGGVCRAWHHRAPDSHATWPGAIRGAAAPASGRPSVVADDLNLDRPLPRSVELAQVDSLPLTEHQRPMLHRDRHRRTDQ